MEFTSLVQNAGLFLAGAVVTFGGFVGKHWPQITKGAAAAIKVWEHLENNQAALAAVQTAEQAATLQPGTDPAVHDLLVKDVMRDALDALKIEAATLDETDRRAIVQFVSSSQKVPDELKPLVPTMIDATLQAIQSGRTTAQSHEAIRAAQTLKITA